MSAVLSYKYPPVLPAGGGISANLESWNSVSPINGSIFRSDQSQSMIFNVAHASQFLRTTMSFFSGKLVPMGADNQPVADAATRNSSLGAMAAWGRLVIRFGSLVVEDIQSYSDLLALYYASASKSKKALLRHLERYGNTEAFTTGGQKYAHLLMSSLFVTDQAIPLPLIANGGISIEIFLNQASSVFTSANVSYYQIESPTFKYMGLTPNPAYTVGLRSAVASGRSVYLAFQKVHQFPSACNGSKTQLIQIPVGQVSSIVSVDTVFWDSNTFADRTADKAKRFIDPGVIDYRIEGAGLSNPSQLTFRHEGANDPELFLIGQLGACGNAYQIDKDADFDDDFLTTSFRISQGYVSDNEHWGVGLNTLASASPFLTLTVNTVNVVPPTTSIMSYVTTDALIEFRGSDVAITEIF